MPGIRSTTTAAFAAITPKRFGAALSSVRSDPVLCSFAYTDEPMITAIAIAKK